MHAYWFIDTLIRMMKLQLVSQEHLHTAQTNYLDRNDKLCFKKENSIARVSNVKKVQLN